MAGEEFEAALFISATLTHSRTGCGRCVIQQKFVPVLEAAIKQWIHWLNPVDLTVIPAYSQASFGGRGNSRYPRYSQDNRIIT
jgi:hypothetical protein